GRARLAPARRAPRRRRVASDATSRGAPPPAGAVAGAGTGSPRGGRKRAAARAAGCPPPATVPRRDAWPSGVARDDLGDEAGSGRRGGEELGMPAAELRLRSEEHTSELQSRGHLVCRLLLEKKN